MWFFTDLLKDISVGFYPYAASNFMQTRLNGFTLTCVIKNPEGD
jgi:hypothetical protein